MFLIQSIYYSEVSADFNSKDIEKILASSRKYNVTNNITGLLAFNGKYFLQALEGLRSDVSQCMERISKDPRHKNLCAVYHKEIAERDFSDWNMAYVGQSKFNRELILRYSGRDEFIPSGISAASSLALLKALRASAEQ